MIPHLRALRCLDLDADARRRPRPRTPSHKGAVLAEEVVKGCAL